MRSFRKLLISFFLLFLLIQSEAILILFLFIKYQHKNDIKQYLTQYFSKDKFELVKIPRYLTKALQGDFRRIEESEFCYKGKLYDIFKEEINTDTIYFYCLRDDKEEELNNSFNEYLTDQKIDAKIYLVKNSLHLLTSFVNYFSSTYLPGNNKISEFCLAKYQQENYISIIPEVKVPPPRLFS
jgi:hypothetical protein